MKLILVPLDFSDATAPVVDEAARLAKAIDGHVVLLHIVRAPQGVPRFSTEMANLAQARTPLDRNTEVQLASIKRDLLTRGVNAHTLQLTGEPSTAIVEQARHLGVDYVVMGSHGHSALFDLVLGSTTGAVLKECPHAVVVVPVPTQAREHRRPGSGGMSHHDRRLGGTEQAGVRTILAAIDLSPVTTRVVRAAVGLARETKARLILLNVTTPAALVRDYAALEAVIAGADPEKRIRGGASKAAAIHGESLQIMGDPVEVILAQAARCGADYIVMGSHGHTALFEVMIGGTAAGVMRRAHCPVLLIPALKRRAGTRHHRSLRSKDPVAWLERAGRSGAKRESTSRPRRGRRLHANST